MRFVPVPYDALEATRPADWSAVTDLYRRAHSLRWRAFSVTDRSLATRWGVTRRRAWSILTELAALELLELTKGTNGLPSRVKVVDPSQKCEPVLAPVPAPVFEPVPAPSSHQSQPARTSTTAACEPVPAPGSEPVPAPVPEPGGAPYLVKLNSEPENETENEPEERESTLASSSTDETPTAEASLSDLLGSGEERDRGAATAKASALGTSVPVVVSRAAADSGAPVEAVFRAVVTIVRTITGRPIAKRSELMGDDAVVVRAWSALGWPALEDFERDALLIARAAKESDHPTFANDIRGIDAKGHQWREDSSSRVSSVLRVTAKGGGASWGDRLTLARAHATAATDALIAQHVLDEERRAEVGKLVTPTPVTEHPSRVGAFGRAEWSAAHDAMREAIGREDYEQWFRDVELEGVADGLVVLRAPKFTARMLTETFLEQTEQAVGAPIAIRVTA